MNAVRLADYTTLRVGGPAREFRTAGGEQELVEAVRDADANGVPVLLIGGGSNLVIGDDGFDGLVLQIATRGVDAAAGRVEVAAGEPWDDFVARMVRAEYAGVEALSGIPGCVGATPIQNVGAYGQEVSQTIERVRALDRTTGRIIDIAAADCGFGYRESMFKRGPGRYVALSVVFDLFRSAVSRPIRYSELARTVGVEVGEPGGLAQVRDAVLGLRRGKGMVLDPADHDTWSAGSFFTNPVVAPDLVPDGAPVFPAGEGRVKTSAAWLIEHSGFGKGFGGGFRHGRARLSSKHTLAITNRGDATAADVVALARTIRDGVRQATGITLVPEPVFVGCSLDA